MYSKNIGIHITYVAGKLKKPFSEIKCGDEIFVVSAKDNRLYVGGRLIADRGPVDKPEAERLLPGEKLIDKDRYVVADKKFLDTFKRNISLDAKEVMALEIIDGRGKISFKKFDEKSFKQDFRNPARLSEASAEKLRELISIANIESMGSHRIALVIPQQSNDSDSGKSPHATLLPSSTRETATAFTPEEMESTKSEAENIGVLLKGFEGEDQDVLVKRRVNQGRFRKSLLRYWSGCCCVNQVKDERLLVASHIVPWSKASKQERGDPANGLLLSVVWDALFDRGIISFRDDGGAILGRLDRTLLDALGIDETKTTIVGDKLTPKHKEYLRRHRMLFRFE